MLFPFIETLLNTGKKQASPNSWKLLIFLYCYISYNDMIKMEDKINDTVSSFLSMTHYSATLMDCVLGNS